MPIQLSHGRMGLICAFTIAFVQYVVLDGAIAQFPKPLVPGSDKIVLGAFVLRHPDVLAELRLDAKAFQDLHSELESQVRRADGTDRLHGLDRAPLTADQARTLNWLLLDSLSPTEGSRLVQLLNRQAVILAQRPHESRIVVMPIPAFAHPIQKQWRLSPNTSESLDQLFQASYAVLQKHVDRYRASVNEELRRFLENAHANLDEETHSKLTALLGRKLGNSLWTQNTHAPQDDDVLRRLQRGRGTLFPELWFDDSKSGMAVGPALNRLIYFLADNEDIAQKELALTPAQAEWIAHAAEIGRAPLPTIPEWQRNVVDQLQFLMHESHWQYRQQSFIRDEFIAALQPSQLERFRELVNQVVVGDLPVTWLAFDPRVRRRLVIDEDCVSRLDEAQEALAQALAQLTSAFRDDCWKVYRKAEQDALGYLTAHQRDQYREWFGALFAFENPTWRTLLGLDRGPQLLGNNK